MPVEGETGSMSGERLSDVLPTRDGVRGRVGDDWLEVCGAARPGDLPALDAAPGCGIAWFSRNGQPLGYFELDDPLRPGAAQALRALWERGVKCRLASGDRQQTTLAAAHSLGVHGLGGLTQTERALHVRNLQRAGAQVLFVGDGVCDRPNLAGADVTIGMAPGALARAVDAPIVSTGPSLGALPHLFDLATALRARLRENYVVAAIYNAVVMPLAAAGFLSPLEAAGLMLVETLVVLANSARLLRTPKGGACLTPEAGSSGKVLLGPPLDMQHNAP
jgi:Cu2+-exporting ATPase